jgi:hypothetical protein
MPQEQTSLFRDLANGLPENQKAEFFKTLHEAGISPKDEELVRLLRALQLYKAYYETIPEAVKQASGTIEQLKKDIERISSGARANLELSTQLAGKVIQEAERIHQDFEQIHKHIEAAMRKSAENLASGMAKQLAEGIEGRILSPLQSRLEKLAGSGKAFEDAIALNNEAAASLKKSTATASRFHIKAYAICGLLALLVFAGGAAFSLYRWYSDRFNTECETLIKQTDQNRAVLLLLSKSHRTLETLPNPQNPNRKLLIMKNASGYQAAGKHGVIEFDE